MSNWFTASEKAAFKASVLIALPIADKAEDVGGEEADWVVRNDRGERPAQAVTVERSGCVQVAGQQ